MLVGVGKPPQTHQNWVQEPNLFMRQCIHFLQMSRKVVLKIKILKKMEGNEVTVTAIKDEFHLNVLFIERFLLQLQEFTIRAKVWWPDTPC